LAELFKEILPSILENKQPVEMEDKDYPAFIVNKALSFHFDCLSSAYAMDQNSQLPPKLQYDFMLHSVRGYKRRFVPWHKAIKNEDIDLVRQHYGYSYRKAIEALQILTEEQIAELRALYKTTE
jgi:NACalpha-BTF3-like transcription factor